MSLGSYELIDNLSQLHILNNSILYIVEMILFLQLIDVYKHILFTSGISNNVKLYLCIVFVSLFKFSWQIKVLMVTKYQDKKINIKFAHKKATYCTTTIHFLNVVIRFYYSPPSNFYYLNDTDLACKWPSQKQINFLVYWLYFLSFHKMFGVNSYYFIYISKFISKLNPSIPNKQYFWKAYSLIFKQHIDDISF